MTTKRIQAVVLIHGIGEQRPLATLRGFVDAVWKRNDSLFEPGVEREVWSKPDHISGNLELRRLTTGYNKAHWRVDFFEFYWAHLLRDTSVPGFLEWAKRLLWRSPKRVPKALRAHWVVAWLLVALLIAVALHLPRVGGVAAVLAAAIVAWARHVLIQIPGDAATYLDPAPSNVMARTKIREAGLELLHQLHAEQRHGAPRYSRIVLVGHSLGSVIAYDILKHAWPHYNRAASGAHPALREVTGQARALMTGSGSRRMYRLAQRTYFEAATRGPGAWRVTDLVTLGSPLAHATLLLANDPHEFEDRKRERELPTCPPVLEKGEFVYGPHNTPHHASHFALVRWTNLYFKSKRLVYGDPIGGPVGSHFGPGVLDIKVQGAANNRQVFTHEHYWTTTNHEVPSAVQTLQEVLDLAGGTL